MPFSRPAGTASVLLLKYPLMAPPPTGWAAALAIQPSSAIRAAADRSALEEIAASPSNPYRAVREAKGLLLAADGIANQQIALRLGVSRSTVLEWRRQFSEDGPGKIGLIHASRA